jgi:hypothetical protein
MEYPVWRTIEIGNGLKTKAYFCQKLSEHGMFTDEHARELMGRPEFTVAPVRTQVDLVSLRVKDLGLTEDLRCVSFEAAVSSALRRGFHFCPAEVGPQLRLQYPDQPSAERGPQQTVIVMREIWNGGGNGWRFIFALTHWPDGLCLGTKGIGRRDNNLYIEDELIMVCPRT